MAGTFSLSEPTIDPTNRRAPTLRNAFVFCFLLRTALPSRRHWLQTRTIHQGDMPNPPPPICPLLIAIQKPLGPNSHQRAPLFAPLHVRPAPGPSRRVHAPCVSSSQQHFLASPSMCRVWTTFWVKPNIFPTDLFHVFPISPHSPHFPAFPLFPCSLAGSVEQEVDSQVERVFLGLEPWGPFGARSSVTHGTRPQGSLPQGCIGRGDLPPPHPGAQPVSLTPSASINGVCNRQ